MAITIPEEVGMSEMMRRVIFSGAVILLVICLYLSLFLLIVAGAIALHWM